MLSKLGIDPERLQNCPIFQATGCAQCKQTGYRGRTGIYEWLCLTEEIRELVLSRAPSLLIRRKAVDQGMQTLRESGLSALFDGATTVDEVVKYT